jgi:hypothetical protein
MRGCLDGTIPDYINTVLTNGQTFYGDAVALLGVQAASYTIITDASLTGNMNIQLTDFDNVQAGPNYPGRDATFNNAGFGAVGVPSSYLRTIAFNTTQLNSKWMRIVFTATAAGRLQMALTLRATSS